MGQKILIIDDEPAILGILSDVLTSEGYTVNAASDGETGIEKVKEFNPALIILDVVLPGINGFEVCKILKEDQQTKNIAIIILTGISTLAEHKQKAFQLGADDYLTKPFGMSDLLERIKKLITGQNNQK
ncbi:MAG: response regulator [Elusimicrobia bacterium]|nr:response regulator [Elusimicrobiota bacterium]